MTEQEKQEIVAGVLQALKTNSLTLDQLSETAECSDSDFVELSKGRKISAENLSKHFVDKEFSNISERALSNKVLTGHINKMTTEYNVSVFHPGEGIDGTDKYTLETAIAKIPEQVRNVGIKCSFLDDGGKLQTWEFTGGAGAGASFSKVGAEKIEAIENEIGQINQKIKEIIRRLEKLESGGGIEPGTESRVVGDILYLADGIAHSAEGMLAFIGGAAYSEEKLTINR